MVKYNVEIHEFSDGYEFANKLASRISDLLLKSIESKDRASLVVSGGTTPVQLFEVLADRDIPWSKVWITLADERWVDTASRDSNERLVREHLLKKKAGKAKFVGLFTGSTGGAEDGERESNLRISQIGLPFTVLVLGMGKDGHTASIFPGSKGLEKAVDLDSKSYCVAIKPGDSDYERMTLTLPTLLRSENIFLHITGPEKKEALDKALKGKNLAAMPIRYIFEKSTSPVEIYWAP